MAHKRKPIGKSQKRLLQFAQRNRGIHSFAKDSETIRIVTSLKKRGLIKVNKFKQFSITQKGSKRLK